MNIWQKIIVGLCWLLVAAGPMNTSCYSIMFHMYRYNVDRAFLVQEGVRNDVISLGIAIALCFAGWLIARQNTSKAYWLNFTAIFALYAICFAVALHFAALGALTVKCVKGYDANCFSERAE
jgi:hypothetical protein